MTTQEITTALTKIEEAIDGNWHRVDQFNAICDILGLKDNEEDIAEFILDEWGCEAGKRSITSLLEEAL